MPAPRKKCKRFSFSRGSEQADFEVTWIIGIKNESSKLLKVAAREDF